MYGTHFCCFNDVPVGRVGSAAASKCFKYIFRWLLYGQLQSYIPDGNLRRDLCDLLTYWEIQSLVDLGYFMIWEWDKIGSPIVFRNLIETIALLKKRQLLLANSGMLNAKS
jgi:hypothetical protein